MTTQKTWPGHRCIYKPEFVAQAEMLYALGATHEEIAAFFGVTRRAVSWWEANHPDFHKAVKVGRERARERLERSLYQRAVGYTFHGEKVSFPKGSRKPVLLRYQQHVPSDPYAAATWLKLHHPALWREPRVRRELRQRMQQDGAAPELELEKTNVILPPNGRD
jgi:hypothetical protein